MLPILRGHGRVDGQETLSGVLLTLKRRGLRGGQGGPDIVLNIWGGRECRLLYTVRRILKRIGRHLPGIEQLVDTSR